MHKSVSVITEADYMMFTIMYLRMQKNRLWTIYKFLYLSNAKRMNS